MSGTAAAAPRLALYLDLIRWDRPAGWLLLRGITRNNVKDLDVDLPLGVFTSVTGVSGSGKSSLVSQALVELVAGARLDVPLFALVQLEVPAYEAAACPMCAAGTPVTKPGSRA